MNAHRYLQPAVDPGTLELALALQLGNGHGESLVKQPLWLLHLGRTDHLLERRLPVVSYRRARTFPVTGGQPECMNNGVAKIYAKFLYRIGYSFWCTQSGPSNGYIIR